MFDIGISLNEFYMIAGMAVVTFGIRYIMFPISGRFKFPELFNRGLKYVPPVVLTAIIVPSVLMPHGNTLNLKLTNPYLVGAIAACVIEGLFKNLLLTLVVSMIIFLVCQWTFAFGAV